ncbi:MAG: hypothetical protein ACMXYM_04690 [Candidatus Woesearchaeota archaeon]
MERPHVLVFIALITATLVFAPLAMKVAILPALGLILTGIFRF